MDERIKRQWREMAGRKIALIGIGVSNTDVMLMLAGKGLDVTALDRHTEDDLGDVVMKLRAAGIKLQLGEHYLDQLDYDIIFRTPGMYYYHPALVEARRQGRIVTSEMELFFDLCPCRIIAVTGSDGKTTTTTLIAKMLEAAGRKVHLGGNIGRALLPLVERMEPEDFAVVELSSFQLLSMREKADIAVVTNVSPNHLDVHKDMEEYVQAKRNLVLGQTAFSRTVLSLDCPRTMAFAPDVRGELVTFSRKDIPERGAYMEENGCIYMADREGTHPVMHRDDILLLGDHNVENMLAAISAVWGLVPTEMILKVARHFGGVEHRLEMVREHKGVRWYNDSIATSPTRCIAALHSFPQKVILIAGGYDKRLSFVDLGPEIVARAKTLILTGETAQDIRQAVEEAPGYNAEALPILKAADLEEAVRMAGGLAQPGDIVSLSPACASFDAYRNFEARGHHFKALVNALA